MAKIKANILFGNYRFPIKIYYICSFTVDEKKRPAVGTVFAVFLCKKLLKYFSLSLVGWLLQGKANAPV